MYFNFNNTVQQHGEQRNGQVLSGHSLISSFINFPNNFLYLLHLLYLLLTILRDNYQVTVLDPSSMGNSLSISFPPSYTVFESALVNPFCSSAVILLGGHWHGKSILGRTFMTWFVFSYLCSLSASKATHQRGLFLTAKPSLIRVSLTWKWFSF
jgi:hypothetical protein